MPIFEYRCAACGSVSTHLVLGAADRSREPQCESCGGKDLERLVSRPGLVRGGSGGDAGAGELRAVDPRKAVENVSRGYDRAGVDPGRGFAEVAGRAARGDHPRELKEAVKELKAKGKAESSAGGRRMSRSSPLRVALFTYSTKPRGGVVHTLALAEALDALGHEVCVFALGKDGQGFFRPTAVAHRLIPCDVASSAALDERIGRYIDSYAAFLRQQTDPPFDVYHAQDCVSANALWRLREEGRIPAFLRTVHHVDDFTSPFLQRCQHDSILRPDGRIVVSDFWRRELGELFAVDSEVIHNGVDLGRYRVTGEAERRAARARLGLGSEVVVLHIGGIEPRKNSIRLLRAFRRARQRLAEAGRDSVLLLAGGETLLDYTPYRQSFFAELESSGLETDSDVRLLGTVEDELMPDLYRAADLLAFPSLNEGWGLVALEAMASGLPVVASRLPVFEEYLRDGENALLVEPIDVGALAEALVRLGTDDVLRGRLTAAGPKTAARFTWRGAGEAHASFYRQHLLASDPGRGKRERAG